MFGEAGEQAIEARRAGRSVEEGYSQTNEVQPKVFRDSVRSRMAQRVSRYVILDVTSCGL